MKKKKQIQLLTQFILIFNKKNMCKKQQKLNRFVCTRFQSQNLIKKNLILIETFWVLLSEFLDSLRLVVEWMVYTVNLTDQRFKCVWINSGFIAWFNSTWTSTNMGMITIFISCICYPISLTIRSNKWICTRYNNWTFSSNFFNGTSFWPNLSIT